ncbi:MAG: hypothetical protein ACRC5W_00090 [Cetobacterium sp.]
MTTLEKMVITKKISEELKVKLEKFDCKVESLSFNEKNSEKLEIKIVKR